MRRRDFVAGVGGVALASWSRGLCAQQRNMSRRVGVLVPYPETDVEAQADLAAFNEKLRQLGWTAGQNLEMETMWAGGNAASLPSKAKELVSHHPDLILARSTAATRALQHETRTIPIVFTVVSDPVGDHLVDSVAHPGGNITGFTNVEASLGGKWVELVKEIAPDTKRIAIVYDPKTSAGGGVYYARLIKSAADAASLEIVSAPISDLLDVEGALAAFGNSPNGAVIVTPDATTTSYRKAIFANTARHRLPAIYPFRFFAQEGGLASYGVDVVDIYRQAATYVDRILRGAEPADLPIQGPIKFELSINLKTAKILGLPISPSLLSRADWVIE